MNVNYVSCSLTGGFAVMTTIFHERDSYKHENLFQIDYTGRILGVLPCLAGKHKHCLTPVFLPANQELENKYPGLEYGEPGWYLILKDGIGGICGLRFARA